MRGQSFFIEPPSPNPASFAANAASTSPASAVVRKEMDRSHRLKKERSARRRAKKALTTLVRRWLSDHRRAEPVDLMRHSLAVYRRERWHACLERQTILDGESAPGRPLAGEAGRNGGLGHNAK
jgi:hypothetical protein